MFVYIPNFFIIDIFLLLIKNSRIRDFSLLLLRSSAFFGVYLVLSAGNRAHGKTTATRQDGVSG